MAWCATRKSKTFWLSGSVAALSVTAFIAGHFYEITWSANRIVIGCGSGGVSAGWLAADLAPLFPDGLGWQRHKSDFCWLPDLIRDPAFTAIVFPIWILFLLASTVVVVTYRRNGKVAHGTCRTCRYNLTGNTSGVCPECGAKLEMLSATIQSPHRGDGL